MLGVPPRAAPHAREGGIHMQQGLWITLWTSCGKRRASCVEPLWRTHPGRTDSAEFPSLDQGFCIPHPVDGIRLEVHVEGWSSSGHLCTNTHPRGFLQRFSWRCWTTVLIACIVWSPGTLTQPVRAQHTGPSFAMEVNVETARMRPRWGSWLLAGIGFAFA